MTRWMNYTDGMFEEPEGPYVLWVDAEDEVQRLQEKVLRVERGDFSQMCSYCGWEADRAGAKWEDLQQHIKECPAHPLRAAEAEAGRLRAEVQRLQHANAAWETEVLEIEVDYPNWRGKFEKLHDAITWHTNGLTHRIGSLAATNSSLRAERDALAKRVAERDKLIEELQRIHRDTLDAVLAPVPETPPEAQKGPLGIPIEASDSLAPDEVRFVDHTGVKARIVNLAEPPEAQGREEVGRADR